MTIRVQEYIREDGSNPYKSWFDKLEAKAAAKVATAVLRLEMGNTSNIKWFEGIGEVRIDWGLDIVSILPKMVRRSSCFSLAAQSEGNRRISKWPKSSTRNTRLVKRLLERTDNLELRIGRDNPYGANEGFQTNCS